MGVYVYTCSWLRFPFSFPLLEAEGLRAGTVVLVLALLSLEGVRGEELAGCGSTTPLLFIYFYITPGTVSGKMTPHSTCEQTSLGVGVCVRFHGFFSQRS